MAKQPNPFRTNINRLTVTELIVLTYMADGFSNSEIGAAMTTSPYTVGIHVRHVLGKLNAKNRTHAVSLALRKKLII